MVYIKSILAAIYDAIYSDRRHFWYRETGSSTSLFWKCNVRINNTTTRENSVSVTEYGI
jgi:hypothetical protein